MSNPLLASRWDMSNVYPALDSPEFEADRARLSAELDALNAFVQEHAPELTPAGDPAHIHRLLDEFLHRFNESLALAETLGAYLAAFVTTDSFDEHAKRLYSEFQQIHVRLQMLQSRTMRLLGGLGETLEAVIALGEAPGEHAFALREAAEQSRYLMSDAEESLAAELAPSGPSAWSKLQGTVTSQLTVDFELDGKAQTLPMPALINLRSHPDPEVRRRAYQTELEAWKKAEEPLAAALNGVKGTVLVLDRRRGREDALHASLDASRIDRATLDALLSAMRDSFPVFRRYFRAKAHRLGKEKLPWWDLFAPLGKTDTTFTFPQARDFILKHFAEFSPDLADFARRAFENNWIDAEQRPGKRGGAFCMGLPAVKESRVLCNFDGSLDQVFTIAHELGHGYHNHCLYRAGKTPLQSETPMTLAETASIMCETIVTNAVLEQADDPQEQLAILETSLISDSQVIVDIYSRFLFEKEVFERRAQAELSAADLCDIMARAQKETYGEALDEEALHPYMWTWKPHYYYAGFSFYNYPYAFGLLFGLGLYAIYRQRGAAFVEDYRNLLASTGEGNAADLAARFGIDIRDRAFWDSSLQMVAERVARYEALPA